MKVICPFSMLEIITSDSEGTEIKKYKVHGIIMSCYVGSLNILLTSCN